MSQNFKSKRAYLRNYYRNNKQKWKKTRDQQIKLNEMKRERYKNDPKVRAYYIERSKLYRKNNPHKRRERELLVRYRLSAEAYKELLKSQKGRCAICRVKMVNTPHVDHCHKTNKVRGLLCFNCNRAIGHLQDNPQFIRAAANYVERNCSS